MTGSATRPELILLVGAALTYTLLSVLAFYSSTQPLLRAVVENAWNFIWLLGPPITLIHGSVGMGAYIVETVLVVVLVVSAAVRPTRVRSTVLGLAALIVWLLSGFLALAILI